MADLTVPFQILSFLCGLLMLYVMQQTTYDPASQDDAPFLQSFRRIAYTVVICGLAWNISYHDTRSLPASPAEMLTVAGITMLFLVRAIILFQHRKDRVPARRSDHAHQR